VATASSAGEWEQLRERILANPEARKRYDRTRRTLAAVRSILETIDSKREQAGLSKAALAECAGINPASIRRLFTSDGSNPTLLTVLELMDALDLDLVVQDRAKVDACSSGRSTESSQHEISVA
jgi:DNA-binding phage protein